MADHDPSLVRLAGTMLLLRDDPFEVLMVKRNSRSAFASALVFPGGTVDEDDRDPAWAPYLAGQDGLNEVERAVRIAACRETFEECRIMLAKRRDGTAMDRGATAPGERFFDVIRAEKLVLNLSELQHFGHWITPESFPKRFDTHFFLVRAPEGQEAVCDGTETISLEWASPRDVLARAVAGEGSILFPTRMNIKRLADSFDCEAALQAARLRPPFTVLPRLEVRDGNRIVTIPAEAGYGETEDRRLT